MGKEINFRSEAQNRDKTGLGVVTGANKKIERRSSSVRLIGI